MRAKGAENMTKQRLGVAVGFAPDAKTPRTRNTKELREGYVTQTQARGYHAYLRGDGCEGRRFRHFIERGEENKKATGEFEKVQEPFVAKRLKRLERRGMLLAAVLDLVPSLFYSGWMLFPRKR